MAHVNEVRADFQTDWLGVDVGDDNAGILPLRRWQDAPRLDLGATEQTANEPRGSKHGLAKRVSPERSGQLRELPPEPRLSSGRVGVWGRDDQFFRDGSPSRGAASRPHTQGVQDSSLSPPECTKSDLSG